MTKVFAFLVNRLHRLCGRSAASFTLLSLVCAGLFVVAAPRAALATVICSDCTGNDSIFAPNSASGFPTSFTYVWYGNLLTALGVSPGPSGTIYVPPGLDPFCPTSQTSCPVSVSYKGPSPGTTTLVYSGGSGLYPNSQEKGFYHFGYIQAGCQASNCAVYLGPSEPVSAEWTYTVEGKPVPYPAAKLAVACSCNIAKAKSVLVAVVYYQGVLGKTGIPVQSWNAITYDESKVGPGGQPKVKFTNYNSSPIYVTNSGIIVGIAPQSTPQGWMNLLSLMNFAGMPPPGASGSAFKALNKPPKKVLNPVAPGVRLPNLEE